MNGASKEARSDETGSVHEEPPLSTAPRGPGAAGVLTAFASLGFLVGNLIGLSESPTTKSVIGLLFAFVGGSALTFVKSRSNREHRLAGASVVGLTAGCLVGLYFAIFLTEYEWLRPEWKRSDKVLDWLSSEQKFESDDANLPPSPNVSELLEDLRKRWTPLSSQTAAVVRGRANQIDERLGQEKITPSEALFQLIQLLHQSPESSRDRDLRRACTALVDLLTQERRAE